MGGIMIRFSIMVILTMVMVMATDIPTMGMVILIMVTLPIMVGIMAGTEMVGTETPIRIKLAGFMEQDMVVL